MRSAGLARASSRGKAGGLLLLLALISFPAGAVEPDEMLKDPALEARAEHIGQQLRCPVCKTESIEESDADFTKDLRRVVRERVAAGDSDQKVLDFMKARYGDFILLKPPFEAATWALWLAPPTLLVLGGILIAVVMRRRPLADSVSLTASEKAAIEALK